MINKTYLLTMFFLLPLILFSQKNIPKEIKKYKEIYSRFEKIEVFRENKNSKNLENKNVVKEATFSSLNIDAVNKIIANKFQTISIQIPFKNELIDIELYKVNIFEDNFKVTTDNSENVSYFKGVYYRGIIKGNENSIASFNFFENEMNGIISSSDLGNLNIGRLQNKSNIKDYIVYSDNDLIFKPKLLCNTKDEKKSNFNFANKNRNINSNKVVTTYLEVGYQAYQANGSNITSTINWITSIFNNAQTLFDNDGIAISLKSIFVWTEDDFYKTSSNFILPAFANIRPNFNGDIGFVADIDPQTLYGQAFGIGTVCSDRKYAYGDLILDFETIPTFSQPVYVMTHELGHTLGSHHTHACLWNGDNTAIDGCAASYGGCETPTTPPGTQGTIMSYCFPDLSLGFGTQPANAIIQHINNSTCIGNIPNENCINTIGLIDVLNTTQTSTTIQWTDSNALNATWQISVVPFGSPPVWSTVNSNNHLLLGLNSNTYYEILIKGNCSNGLIYPKHSRVFATQGDNCSGTIIYDTGGAIAGYSGKEHIIRTIVPNVPGKKIKLTFNNLNLVPWNAWLFVYDGLDNNGPLLNNLTTNGTFFSYLFGNSFFPSGNTFTSQDPSGALTLEFFSQPYYFNEVNNNGWNATISCLDNNLGNDDFGSGFFDYTYSPNPIQDILKIKSKDTIIEIKIFSIDGKLVLTKIETGTNINMDLSSLTNGTYITKLRFEKGETSFKIIKE